MSGEEVSKVGQSFVTHSMGDGLLSPCGLPPAAVYRGFQAAFTTDWDEVDCPKCLAHKPVDVVSNLGQPEEDGPWSLIDTTPSGNRVYAPANEIAVSKLGQSEPKPVNEQGYPIYPVGTPIAEVSIRDRGQKLIFACDLHPEVTWASKDPFVSRWFGNPEQTPACNCPTGHFFLTQPYSPTRND